MSEFKTHLLAISKILIEQMEELGGNPADPTEVESFVNGCAISKKLKQLICEGSNEAE